MDKLPFEVLVHVLSYLPVADRLNSALTCKRWAWALCTSQLLEDVSLTIGGGYQMKAVEAILLKSHREYRILRLSQFRLWDYHAEFWARIGRNLRELEFRSYCSFPPRVLVQILRACSKLESLNIIGLDIQSSEDFRYEGIKESFSSIRHLQHPRNSSGAVFAHLLRLMPNVTTVSSWHGCLKSDFVNLLPSLLGENRRITELDFRNTETNTEEYGGLIRWCSASVEVLRLDYCRDTFSDEVYKAAGDCTNLRRLSIAGNESFSNDHMKRILLNNPGLRLLELRDCRSLTDEGLAPLHLLKKIRKLVFDYCRSNITSEFLRSLRTIPSLQDVQFREVEFGGRDGEIGFVRSIASLPNLQTLCLAPVFEDPESLRVILHGFENLRELTISNCSGLTESDLAELRHFEQLRSLELHDADELTDLAVREGFGSSALESLTLMNCPLTDHGLASIGAHHSRLRSIKLEGCRNITAAGVVALLRREPLLQRLHIIDLLVTEKFFEALEELCPQLRQLYYCDYSRESVYPVPESLQTRRPAVSMIGFRSLI